MPLINEPRTEPIPGYRLIEFLGRGGFGEVWKCEAPGGLFKAIKFINGDQESLNPDDPQHRQEWKALQLVKTIRHPFLLGIERLEVVDGQVLVVMELADRNLADAFEAARRTGLPGIPRVELLAYLREAAEALDVINLQHNLQHLDVKPANLFLVNRHLKVGDFGLLSRLCDGRNSIPDTNLYGATPLYCAPEVLVGTVSNRSDQFSLAIVYQELVSGTLPFNGKNRRELVVRRAKGEPDLSALSTEDRPVVARALARDPNARYSSCSEFVRRLAPELMPVSSSPFLNDLLLDETPCVGSETGDLPNFAGYQLLDCLGRDQLCETWSVQAADGRRRLMSFVYGLTDGKDSAEAEMLKFLTTTRHRNLLPVEVVRYGNGRVALVTDWHDGSLAEYLNQCHTMGLPGIPRAELLAFLRPVAVALDEFYREHRLQHLTLNPNVLIRNGQRALLANMGLGHLLWLPSGQPVGQINGRYSAPEFVSGDISPSCDQYSLAIIFQELLTGSSPFRGASRGKVRPNLDLLPAPDRKAISRALHPTPERRFATCAQLIDALDHEATGSLARRPSVVLPPVLSVTTSDGSWIVPAEDVCEPSANLQPLSSRQVIRKMLAQAADGLEMHRNEAFSYRLDPGRVLKHDCAAYLAPVLVRLKIESFRQIWNAVLAVGKEDAFALQIPLTGTVWQRLRGRQPSLNILLQLTAIPGSLKPLSKVRVEIRPVYCQPEQAIYALEHIGISILRDLRSALQVEPERRAPERLPFEQPVGVLPVLCDQRLGAVLACQGRDLSRSGLSFVSAESPFADQVYVQSLVTPGLAVLSRVVRVQPRDDSQYVVAVAFAEDRVPSHRDA